MKENETNESPESPSLIRGQIVLFLSAVTLFTVGQDQEFMDKELFTGIISLGLAYILIDDYIDYRKSDQTVEVLYFWGLIGDFLAISGFVTVVFFKTEDTPLLPLFPLGMVGMLLAYEIYRKIRGYKFLLPDRWFH